MRTSLRHSTIAASALIAISIAIVATAQPMLARGRGAAPLTVVYPDAVHASLFYYPPGKLRIASDPSDASAPDLRFLQMIYSGTEATRDSGTFVARSILSFRVVLDPIAPADLNAAMRSLPNGARLKPLPVDRMETTLVWTPLTDDTTTTTAPQSLGNARTQETENASTPRGDGIWTERIFTLNPDPASSQILWDAFHRGRVLLSLSCTFFTRGDDRPAEGITNGNIDAAANVNVESSEPHLVIAPVHSDTIEITTDATLHRDHFRRIDINNGVPPAYAALDIRCYDFNNALRPELARKTVDVRAEGVTGKVVTRSVTFRASSADIDSAALRFPVAVRLDHPFSSRVTETLRDGSVHAGEWTSGGDWARLLDVTTVRKEISQ